MFPSFFNVTRIRFRIFRPTEASISHNNLSVMVTCELMNSTTSSTYLQWIGGSGELMEPGRNSPVALGPVVPKDSGVGIASPRAALLGIPRPVPHTTKSRHGPLASLPGQGPAPSTSTLTMLSDVASTLSSSRTSTS
jgi:hypothetical protein